MDHGIPGCEDRNLSQAARHHNLPVATVTQRRRMGLTGAELVAPAQQRGKPRIVCEKSFEGWSSWFAIKGVDVPKTRIAKDYYSGMKDRLTDEELVARWEKRWLS